MDYARKYRHTSLTLILDFETLLKTFGMRQQKFVTEIHHDGEQKVKGKRPCRPIQLVDDNEIKGKLVGPIPKANRI